MFEHQQPPCSISLKHAHVKSMNRKLSAICSLIFLVLCSSAASQHVPNSNYRRSPPGVPPRHQMEDGSHQNLKHDTEFRKAPQYERGPPGVPSKSHYQEVPTPPQNDHIKFHDPSEYQKTYDSQKNVEKQHLDQHNSHAHGIGEEIDAEHMKQHTKEEYVDFSKISQAEIAIHHFRQFDLDNNGRVDGLEVFKKIRMDAADHGNLNENNDDLDIYIKVVDNALNEYDENKDGYIYYAEFYKAYSKL